jgi:uncharacterized protein YjiS (DUF1127 family)
MLKRIYNYLIKYQEKRVAIWQLNNLTNKQLNDIGLSRQEIYEAVYGKANKNKVKSQRGWKLYKTSNA